VDVTSNFGILLLILFIEYLMEILNRHERRYTLDDIKNHSVIFSCSPLDSKHMTLSTSRNLFDDKPIEWKKIGTS